MDSGTIIEKIVEGLDVWPEDTKISDPLVEKDGDEDDIHETAAVPSSDAPVALRDKSNEDQKDADSIIDMFGDEMMGIAPQLCCTNKCNRKIPKQLAIEQRHSFMELSDDERDLVILSHLQQHRRFKEMTQCYAEQNTRSRVRSKDKGNLVRLDSQHYFGGISICRKMYLFIHGDMGKKKYQNIVKHFDEEGLTPRKHRSKNVKSKRSNVLTTEDYANVVGFIKSYAEQFGHPLPGRLPRFKNFGVIKLPQETTKHAVYEKYIATGMKKMDESHFRKIWLKYCPCVVITKPTADSCDRPPCIRKQTEAKKTCSD